MAPDVVLCWFIILSEHYKRLKGTKLFSETELSPFLPAAQAVQTAYMPAVWEYKADIKFILLDSSASVWHEEERDASYGC